MFVGLLFVQIVEQNYHFSDNYSCKLERIFSRSMSMLVGTTFSVNAFDFWFQLSGS